MAPATTPTSGTGWRSAMCSGRSTPMIGGGPEAFRAPRGRLSGAFSAVRPQPFSATTDGTSMATAPDDAREVENTLRAVLTDVLGLDPARVAAFREETALFGALPEFDSMAVAGLLTELEERLGILIEDHEVDADMMETFGALLTFARAKTLA